MFHRPLLRSRKTVIMNWFCFKIFTPNLVKMVMQLSSQICPVEMREPMLMSLKTWAECALEESLFDLFEVDRKLGLMIFLLAT